MSKPKLPVIGIVIGSILMLSPAIGLIISMLSMNRAFANLGQSGIAEPQALAQNVGNALLSTAAGLFLCPLGIVILVASIVWLMQSRPTQPPPMPPQA
jgi:biopolymer transport protein ExbB/TolQ